MKISADVQVNDLNTGGNPEGIGLGFWSTISDGSPDGGTNFVGLLLRSDGTLSLNQNFGVLVSVPWSGPAFSPTTFYALSYIVDTLTGNISDVSLSGSTADYSPINNDPSALFTDANTTLAGFRADAGNPGRYGFADNFLLESVETAVPEPSTLVLLSLGSLGLIGYAMRKRYRA